MPQLNSAISKCLELLYDYSCNFKVSIELISRLAQQLKLETFIDKLAYTTNGDPSTQRLSIAGSSILIDIDFVKDYSIVSVSVSQGMNEESTSVVGEYMAVETGETTNVTLDISKAGDNISFLSSKTNNDKSSAETILFDNLTSPSLGNFPSNLKYLGNIDSLSSTSNENLFLFIEKVALMLHSINKFEGVLESKDLQISQGFASSVGRVHLNKVETGQLGLLLDFWSDYRLLNTELPKPLGERYQILVDLRPTATSTQKDYLHEAKDHVWQLNDKNYKFEFKDTIDGFNNWTIVLKFNHAITLPIFLLDFLGYKYTVESTDIPEILEKFNNGDQYECVIENNVPFKFINEFSQPQFKNVTSIEITKLSDIAELVPVLRNFLIFSSIARNLRHSTEPLERDIAGDESRKKLRESLKLSSDVTDEEMLGIHALTETANFTNNIQPMRKFSEVETFLEDQDDEDMDVDSEDDYLSIVLESVDFSASNALLFSLRGQQNGTVISFGFKISNGKATSGDDSMNIDGGKWHKFIEVLNVSEDIVLSLQSII